tara:strand:+ start:895 stop:1110 length:216 start_codon:yes stop_codon:yes gene_type:complete
MNSNQDQVKTTAAATFPKLAIGESATFKGFNISRISGGVYRLTKDGEMIEGRIDWKLAQVKAHVAASQERT